MDFYLPWRIEKQHSLDSRTRESQRSAARSICETQAERLIPFPKNTRLGVEKILANGLMR